MATRLLNGLVLVVVGAVLLMNTTGYLPWSVWESALRFWPALLVGLGLQVAVGRRFPGLALAALAILILAAMTPYSGGWISSDGNKNWSLELKPAIFRLELSLDAPSLELNVRGDGNLNVRQPALAASVDLEWDNVEPDTTNEEISETLRATIRPRVTGNRSGKQHWDVALNPSLATSMSVGGGVSDLSIDTTSMYLETLNVASGVAKINLTCGLSGKETRVNVTGGVGNITVNVPEAAGLKVTLTGPLSLISDYSKQGMVKTGNFWATPGFDGATTKVTVFVTCGAGRVDVSRAK